MCFDVPKIVRSPGYDHGHDEESRNGRDIKIDILEAYVWISQVFWVRSEFYRSTGRLPEPPGNLIGLSGPRWKRGKEARAEPHTPPPSPNRTRRGGRRPLSFLLSPSLPFPLLLQLGKEGVLLPVGVGLLPGAPSPARLPPPPWSFIYRGRGGTSRHKN